MDELEDVFRLKQVFQSVLAQIAEAGLSGQARLGERGGELGEQHLASVGGGHDASCTVHRRTEEVALSRKRLADMHPHPHAQGPGLTPGFVPQCTLCLQARLDAVCGGREDGHQAVSQDLDHAPVRVPTASRRIAS